MRQQQRARRRDPLGPRRRQHQRVLEGRGLGRDVCVVVQPRGDGDGGRDGFGARGVQRLADQQAAAGKGPPGVADAADADVFVLEYPGYGARAGSPGKDNFVAAAEAAFQLLPKNLPRYVVSESIGTGVAGELAKNHPAEIAGLALLAPYSDFAAVAQRRMPFLPAYFLVLDRFNPEECLKSYHGPVKFIVAGADEIIGAAAGEKLFAGYAGPKELQVFPGAHHNDVAGQPAAWWREVFSFWRKNSVTVAK